MAIGNSFDSPGLKLITSGFIPQAELNPSRSSIKGVSYPYLGTVVA